MYRNFMKNILPFLDLNKLSFFSGTTSPPMISKIIPEIQTSIAPKTSTLQSVTTKNPYKWANLQEYQDLWSFKITTTPAPRVRS